MAEVETMALGGNQVIDISKALATQGWMSETELTYLAECAQKSKEIVEIGCYKGRSANAIAPHTNGILTCVDIWSESGTDGWYYDVFMENTKEYKNIVPVNHSSIYAARMFQGLGKTFDMIFIDAAHDEYNFPLDIVAWRPLLRPGGILCGHDYSPEFPAVIDTVKRMIPSYRVIDTIWTTEL